MEMHFKSLNTRDNIFEKLSPTVNDLSKILTNKRKKTVPKYPLSTDKKPIKNDVQNNSFQCTVRAVELKESPRKRRESTKSKSYRSSAHKSVISVSSIKST